MIRKRLIREVNKVRQKRSAKKDLERDRAISLQYDKDRENLTHLSEGEVRQDNQRIAIYLVYQPNGLAQSILHTCDYMNSRGYSVFVVSNGSLPLQDRSTLLKHCMFVLERPNYGHDFGGYRDGILMLEQMGLSPNYLIIMNDSVWFPATMSVDYIQIMEDSGADFAGGHEMYRRPWNDYKILLPSYFLMFKSTALRSKAFKDFWQSYVQSSDVFATVTRGEHGLSRAMYKGGLRCEGIVGRREIKSAVKKLSEARIRKYVTYTNQEIPQLSKIGAQLSETDHNAAKWLPIARKLLNAATRRTFTNSIPVIALEELKFPFIKKKKSAFSSAHRVIIRAFDNGDLRNVSTFVIEEIRAQLEKD